MLNAYFATYLFIISEYKRKKIPVTFWRKLFRIKIPLHRLIFVQRIVVIVRLSDKRVSVVCPSVDCYIIMNHVLLNREIFIYLKRWNKYGCLQKFERTTPTASILFDHTIAPLPRKSLFQKLHVHFLSSWE